MKKTLVVFGIFVALFALFAISCSADVLRQPYASPFNWPFGVNVAQPSYSRSSNTGVVQWAESVQPTSTNRSAFGFVPSYYTPDNNQYASSSYVTDWNGTTSTVIYYLFQYDAQFLGTLSNYGLPGAYLHLIFDFGAGPWNSSMTILRNLYIQVGLSDDMYRIPVNIEETRRVGFVDIPVVTGRALPNLSLVFIRPDNIPADSLGNYGFAIYHMWAICDNSQVYERDDSLLQYMPCGYTNVYLDSNGYFASLPTSDVDTGYWYDLGKAQAQNTAYFEGYNTGFNDGVSSVVDENGDPVSIRSLILTIPDALVGLLRSLFDYNVVGINLFSIFKFILALLAVVFVVRLVMRSLI